RRGIHQVSRGATGPDGAAGGASADAGAGRTRGMSVLRSALFNLYFFGLTAVLTLAGTLQALVVPERSLGVAILWARLVVAGVRVICGIRFEVSGREWLPTGGPALLASVHQSAFDTLVWLTLMPRCCYVMKRELLRIPLLGPLMGKTGMIAVDRAA